MSRRRTVLLASSALVAGLGLVAPASSHAAAECAGTGSATLSAGLSYFPTVATNVGFSFTFNCASGGSVTGSGTLTSASCGKSSGSGTIAETGATITVETAGSMLVVTGGATGGGNATPVPDTSTVPFGNSCSNGTAKVFTLAGGISY